MYVIITTLHTKEKAKEIGKGLLEERLIACYNLFPIESSYWWKGKIIDEEETMVMMKTTDAHFEEIEAYIKKYSGYEVPEVLAFSPDKVNSSYLSWVNSETEQQ